MENSGWVSLHRKILDNPLSDKPDWFSVWVHLLLLANHCDRDMIWNFQKITIKSGQLLTGRHELARKCGVSGSLVERVLTYLENEQQIGQQKTTKYRIITILNWEKYQKSDNKQDSKRTASGQQADTNNNYNNINNDNNKIERGEKSPPPPKEITIKFFGMIEDKGKEYEDFIEKLTLSTKIPKEKVTEEIKKFWEYWTEMNQTGTKQRWEKEKVFEIKRRLTTWLNNNNKWSQNSKFNSKYTPNFIL